MPRTYHRTRSILLFIVIGALIALPAAAEATNLRITEFMYNAEGSDVGREYIEIINTGPNDMVITNVRLTEHGRNHAIKPYRGETVLTPGTVAVIADKPETFLTHHDYTGPLFDSTFNLNNTGSTLSLSQNGQELHSISYTKQDGADGDGNALHISRNNTLLTRTPSPGEANGIPIERNGTANTVPSPTATDTTTESDTAQTEPNDGVQLSTQPNIIFSASTTSFSMIETPTEPIETGTNETTDNGTELTPLYGAWNFGDGTRLFGDTVTHAYLHPGTYIISFQEYEESVPTDRGIISRTVTALFPDITIERKDDTFVIFKNNHPFTLNVSDWRISSGQTVFVFPNNSFVPASGTSIIPLTVPESATETGITHQAEQILFITAGGGQFSGTETTKPAQQSDTTTEQIRTSGVKKDNTAQETVYKERSIETNERTAEKNGGNRRYDRYI